jgi:hypothetical protein
MIDKLHLLQQVLSSLRSAREPAVAAVPPRRTPRPPHAPGERGMTLEQQLRRRIEAIPADDPQRRRRMLRATIESALSAEWGDEMSADPAFHELVDRVVRHLESDPSVQSLVDEAMAPFATPGGRGDRSR